MSPKRAPGPRDFFPGHELIRLLSNIADLKVDFLVGNEPIMSRTPPLRESSFVYVKHDIHRDLHRSVRLAREEASAGLRATYFVPNKTDVSSDYFGTTQMWDALTEIVSLDHAIGLHVDPYAFVDSHGSIMAGIEQVMDEFDKHGIEVRCANSHGNTLMKKKTGTQPRDFYQELRQCSESVRNTSDSASSKSDVYWSRHLGSVSLEALSANLGIDVWADASFWLKGKRLLGTRYVSDNSRSVQLAKSQTGEPGFQGCPFKITKVEARSLARKLQGKRSVMLFHPQFYEFRASKEKVRR